MLYDKSAACQASQNRRRSILSKKIILCIQYVSSAVTASKAYFQTNPWVLAYILCFICLDSLIIILLLSKIFFYCIRFGRKKILVLGLFLNITINLACSFSTNLMMFIILKAACGFFAAGSLMTMVVYCTECISEKKITLGSMILWTFYSLGGVVLALTSYSTQNWRKLALFTSTPYISVLLISL